MVLTLPVVCSNTDFSWNDEKSDQFSLQYKNSTHQWISLLHLRKIHLFSGREEGGRNGHDGQINFTVQGNSSPLDISHMFCKGQSLYNKLITSHLPVTVFHEFGNQSTVLKVEFQAIFYHQKTLKLLNKRMRNQELWERLAVHSFNK